MSAQTHTPERKTRVLVLSGVDIPTENLDPNRPQPDYMKLVEAFQTDTLDMQDYRRVRKPILGFIRPQFVIGWMALKRLADYDAIVAMSDDIGLPLAVLMTLLRRRGPLYIVCQNIITKRPAFYLRWLRAGTAVRRFLTISETQTKLIQERYKFPPQQIYKIDWHIDHRFFTPQPETPVRHQICSAGLASRDYATLVEATRGLGVDVMIDANSAWYQLKTNVDEAPPHDRVHLLHGKSTLELRQLYAESKFVVVPLKNVLHPVGYTVILEAMAMGKPVIVTRTMQHGDFIVEGWNGFYVAPNNPAELRARIQYLLDHPEEVSRLGANARKMVEERFTLDHFAARVRDAIQSTAVASPTGALDYSNIV